MTSKKPGNKFKVSRAVEEPLDATFQLGEELGRQAGQLYQTIFISIIGSITVILLLCNNLYEIILLVNDLSLGNVSLNYPELIELILSSLMIIFILSIIITTLVYLYQIRIFNNHLLSRYDLVAKLKNTSQPDEYLNKKTDNKKKMNKEKMELKDKQDKNPIFATMDLVEEAMHELPQLIRLLNICKYFMCIILIFIELNFIAEILKEQSLFFKFGLWEISWNLVIWIFILISIISLIRSERLFTYLKTRHDIIDSIRFGDPKHVPEGKSQLDRIITFLSKSDPFILNSGKSKTNWEKNKKKINGISGREYTFDAYFSGKNNLSALSQRVCVPIDKFSVFIKIFKSPITIQTIKEYHDSVVDVCKKNDTFPLRIIALQHKIEELDEKVYDYVLENPVEFESCPSHIQVIAEDGDIYSFIPQISYGKV